MGSKVQTRAEEVERNYKESTIYIHEFDTELEPSFTGAFRVNGTLYSFSSETPTAASWATIKTAGVDTQVYVKAVPSGDSCTLEYTTTAPTFDTSKLGWYSPTAGQENHRYITDSCEEGYLVFGAYLDTTDLYVYKHIKGSGRVDRHVMIYNEATNSCVLTLDNLYKIDLAYNNNNLLTYGYFYGIFSGSVERSVSSNYGKNTVGAYSAMIIQESSGTTTITPGLGGFPTKGSATLIDTTTYISISVDFGFRVER